METNAVNVAARSFTVAPSIIKHVIANQSGSLAKAVMEAVMNSLDANATRVDIETTETGLKITDNGAGFASKEDIYKFFEVFGFDHAGMSHKTGLFGVGRGQLMSFAKQTWRTASFEMRVDLATKGLAYELVEGLEKAAGLTIDATLYEPMSTAGLIAFERELKELVAYAEIEVCLNGKRISRQPAQEQWTCETPQAWVRLSETQRTLAVYNLGFLVKHFDAWQFGVGGVVVTKPGVRLELNMARNDIIVSSCKVWRKLRPFLQARSQERTQRAARLTDAQLANLVHRFVGGEVPLSEVERRKVIVDVVGKRRTIEQFIWAARATTDRAVTACSRAQANAVAEATHKNRHAFVLSDRTLTTFGVGTVTEFMTLLIEGLGRTKAGWAAHEAATLAVIDDWRDGCRRLNDGYTEVEREKWTKREAAAIDALGDRASWRLAQAIELAGAKEGSGEKRRRLSVGLSEVALAWTDGKSVICLNRDLLKNMDRGLPGVMRVISVMVHELLHEEPSTSTHTHDMEFYERFERVMCFFDEGNEESSVGAVARRVLSSYLKACARMDQKGTSRISRDSDLADRAAIAARAE